MYEKFVNLLDCVPTRHYKAKGYPNIIMPSEGFLEVAGFFYHPEKQTFGICDPENAEEGSQYVPLGCENEEAAFWVLTDEIRLFENNTTTFKVCFFYDCFLVGLVSGSMGFRNSDGEFQVLGTQGLYDSEGSYDFNLNELMQFLLLEEKYDALIPITSRSWKQRRKDDSFTHSIKVLADQMVVYDNGYWAKKKQEEKEKKLFDVLQRREQTTDGIRRLMDQESEKNREAVGKKPTSSKGKTGRSKSGSTSK